MSSMADGVPNGILLVDKPYGWSSFKVVAVVRRILSQTHGKRIKVGHAGTLDPFATGLLIILVGDACKEASRFLKLDKSYQVKATLGATSTTGDPEGEVAAISSKQPTLDEITKVTAQFTGEQLQKPPIYSAIKIDGKRAYHLARKGEAVDIPARTIVIHSLTVDGYSYPTLEFTCHVSSGTYIRSLVEDIGHILGVGAYTSELRRLSIGQYSVNEADGVSDTTSYNDIVDAIQSI